MRFLKFSWLFLFLMSYSLMGQELKYSEVEMPHSKEAKKKGMYVTTAPAEDGKIRSYIAYDLKKDELGFDVITFDNSGKMLDNASEIANKTTEAKYGITIPDPGTVENPAGGKTILRLVSALGYMGKMKVEKGYFEPKYATSTEYGPYITTYTSILRGYRFQADDKFKSDTKLNVYAAHMKEEDNIERNYTILEGMVSGTIAYIDASSKASFLGKDANFDKDSPNASNVITTGVFDGQSAEFSNMKETVLDYNCQKVCDGYSANGDRAVLLSTLNAPATVAAWKKFQAKGKPYMTYMSFDLEGNVVENITFDSKSVRGNFALHSHKGANYVLGAVNADHDGYYRFDIGKPTHFQVVKLENGKVAAQENISVEAIEKMIVLPAGEKGKLKSNDIKFFYFDTAPNGDMLAFAVSGSDYYIYQIGADAKLNAFYLIPKLPGKELFGGGIQMLTSDDDIYVLIREVSPEISQGVKKSISKGAGYMKNTNFSRVDEYTTYGRIVRINPGKRTCSAPYDIDKDVILGDDPMMLADDGGVLMPTRTSKRIYKLAAIK